MSRDELILNQLVEKGIVEEIKDVCSNDNANDMAIAQFIYDMVKSVECEVMLDELHAYYGALDS